MFKQITVTVSDGKSTDKKDLIIKLTNVNDNNPIITFPKDNQTVSIKDADENIMKIQVTFNY